MLLLRYLKQYIHHVLIVVFLPLDVIFLIYIYIYIRGIIKVAIAIIASINIIFTCVFFNIFSLFYNFIGGTFNPPIYLFAKLLM